LKTSEQLGRFFQKGTINMNMATARKVISETVELLVLCSRFQATYGKDYRLKPGSPQNAWELYQAIFDKQRIIAELLDSDALERPLKRWGEWWKRQETIDIALVNELAKEANHLIACCAYNEVNTQSGEVSSAVRASQGVIAGILHPSARQVALANLGQIQ
jgi:hypothetical protein